MMKSKHFLIFSKQLFKFKFFEFQISWFGFNFFYNIIDLNLKLLDDEFFYLLNFSLFGNFLGVDFSWSKKRDHAGISIEINLFGLYIGSSIRDSRHWNCDKNKWEE